MKHKLNFNVRDLGQQPSSKAMREILVKSVEKREPSEQIIIHHYADRKDGLLLVIERRSISLGLKFENKVV